MQKPTGSAICINFHFMHGNRPMIHAKLKRMQEINDLPPCVHRGRRHPRPCCGWLGGGSLPERCASSTNTVDLLPSICWWFWLDTCATTWPASAAARSSAMVPCFIISNPSLVQGTVVAAGTTSYQLDRGSVQPGRYL